MLYDCEIEGCTNKTEDFLCAYHERESKNENMQIVVCYNCNKILKLESRIMKEPRYKFVKDCMKCRKKADETFDDMIS